MLTDDCIPDTLERAQLKQLNRQVWSWTKKVRQPIDVDNDLPSDRTNIFRHEDGLGLSSFPSTFGLTELKKGKYPLGHPDIYTRVPVRDFSQYFGLAKIDILPPPDLFHPVLPFRCGGKLTFPLCAACVREQQQVPMSRQVKTSIVEIRNSDELCCARAIVTLKAWAELEIVKRKVKVEEGKLSLDGLSRSETTHADSNDRSYFFC